MTRLSEYLVNLVPVALVAFVACTETEVAPIEAKDDATATATTSTTAAASSGGMGMIGTGGDAGFGGHGGVGGATTSAAGGHGHGGHGHGGHGHDGHNRLCEPFGTVGCCDSDVARYCDDAGTVHEVSCANGCGWLDDGYYFCDGVGVDPSGTYPLACP